MFAVIPSLPSMGPFRVQPVTQQDVYGGDAVPDAFKYTCVGDANDATDDVTIYHPLAPDRADEPRIFYGVSFPGELRHQQTETWTLRYEGALPGADGRTGYVADDAGRFHDPTVDYCDVGAEVGDLLVLTPEEPYRCEDGGVVFEGEVFEWTIEEVRVDTLVLAAGSGRVWAAREADPDADPLLPSMEDVTPDGGLALPTLACFGGPLRYELRADDQYVVTGSFSGYLHDWVNEGGACVKRSGADERFTGRLEEATLKADTELTRCPPDQDAYDNDYDGDYFENFAFKVRMYPGCERALDGTITSLEGQDGVRGTERGVGWRFSVSSGHGRVGIITGVLPERIAALNGAWLRLIYVIDSAGEAIYELLGRLGVDSVNHAFQ